MTTPATVSTRKNNAKDAPNQRESRLFQKDSAMCNVCSKRKAKIVINNLLRTS